MTLSKFNELILPDIERYLNKSEINQLNKMIPLELFLKLQQLLNDHIFSQITTVRIQKVMQNLSQEIINSNVLDKTNPLNQELLSYANGTVNFNVDKNRGEFIKWHPNQQNVDDFLNNSTPEIK